MMFSVRSRFSARASLAPLALGAWLLVLGAAGCENKHVGRTCDLATDGGATVGMTATINSEALECPSRICLYPVATAPIAGSSDTAPFCTADCSSDDDCSDAETGPKGSGTDHHCENGFTCAVATKVGPFCCRRFCICRDFVGLGPQATPAECMAGSGTTCQNVPQ